MAAYGVYGNGSCGGDVYVHGDDTDLYHQVVVLSKPDGSCIRSHANGSSVCGGGIGSSGGGGGGAVIAETANGRCNGEQQQQHQLQQPYDTARMCGGGGVGGGSVAGVGGVGGPDAHRRHRRSFWCRTTTLATISALLATMFCITCAIFLYYNYIYNWSPKTVALQVGKTDPCRALKCSHGQHCVSDKSGGARCECAAAETECTEDVDEPVCGTDWRDYPSTCHVRKASCLSGRSVSVKYKGPCGNCAR